MAFRFHHREGGQSVVPVKLVPATASTDYVAGGLGNLESGALTLAAAADTAIVGVINETKSVGASATGVYIEVIEALSDVVFEAEVITSGTKKTLEVADIGTAFDLDGTDPTLIKLDDSTGGMCVYVGGFNATKKTGLFKIQAANRSEIVGGITFPAG